MPRMMCSPGTEVIGTAMLSYIDNVRQDMIRPLLEQHNLVDIEPDKWYPLTPWLHVINEMSKRRTFEEVMVAVGMQIAEYGFTPEELKLVNLEAWLEGWNQQFLANHRNGEVGEIITEKIADKHYRTIHRHVYPDALNYGLAYAFSKKLLPPGTHFVVKYEDIFHRLDYGDADETVIIVKWD